MGNYEENLIGNAIPLMEVDDDEQGLDSNLIFRSEIQADITDIVDHIGQENFREIYENLYNEIMSLDIEQKIDLCQRLNDKIFEVYDFEFFPSLDFNTENEINEFLDFIKFLEYNYIKELALIIEGMNIVLLKKNTELFLEDYSDQIISKIDFLIDGNKFSELISEFFRTNNKDNIIQFIRSKFEKDKMIIILKTMEGENLDE